VEKELWRVGMEGVKIPKVDWRPQFGSLIIDDIFKFVCQIRKIASCISCLKYGNF